MRENSGHSKLVDCIMAASLTSETTASVPVRGWHPKTGPTLNSDMLTHRPWDCSDIFYIYFVDGQVTERHFSPD